jgi:hypothetical protein
MNENFFDLFGNMFFGKGNDDTNPLFHDFGKRGETPNNQNPDDINKFRGDAGDTDEHISSKYKEYINKLMEFYGSQFNTTPPEILSIQNQIEAWSTENITHGELDAKISNVLGQPISVKIVLKDESLFEEKTWVLGEGVLIRHRELTKEEENKGLVIEELILDNPTEFILNFNDSRTDIEPIKEKSLQEQLDDAVKNEEYELACILRDKMKEIK